MKRHIEFVMVFWLYWKHHRAAYAFRLARDIAYRGLPF